MSRRDGDPTSPLSPAPLDKLMAQAGEPGRPEGIQIGMVSFRQPVDSSKVSSDHWLAMARTIEEQYDDFDGFVILHGTDTMAYTTSALSFLLNNLDKPVVVTGSQLPIDDPRTDARQNFVAALHIAGYKATGLPKVREVALVFMDRVLRGNRATKVSSAYWQGFDSPNYPPLGTIGEHIRIRQDLLLRRKDKEGTRRPRFAVDKALAKFVRVILVHPALTPDQLKADLQSPDLEGVILLTYGAGNMPDSAGFLQPIKEAIEGHSGYPRKLVILNVTQCLQGTVEMGLYQVSSGLLEAGVASGLDMTLEAALTKMLWALRRYKGDDVRTQLQISQSGEQSESLIELLFRSSEPGDVVAPEARGWPGRFDSTRLKRVLLRLQGLSFDLHDSTRPASIRVFINDPHADGTTDPEGRHCVQDIALATIPPGGDLLRDITSQAIQILDEGTVSVVLVGINAAISCRAIRLSVYTEA